MESMQSMAYYSGVYWITDDSQLKSTPVPMLYQRADVCRDRLIFPVVVPIEVLVDRRREAILKHCISPTVFPDAPVEQPCGQHWHTHAANSLPSDLLQSRLTAQPKFFASFHTMAIACP